jgi:CheY-like chemotaxis protein
MSIQPLGVLFDELEQTFPVFSKGRPIRLQLQATHAMASQKISQSGELKHLLLTIVARILESRGDGDLLLHVRGLRASIAFDFSPTALEPDADLQRLGNLLGAGMHNQDGILRLEVPRDLTTLEVRQPSSRRHPRSLRGLHLLLVDDDRTQRRQLTATLMQAGIEVHACSHEEAGFEIALLEAPIAALVVHIHRPLSTGLEFVHRLRDAGITFPLLAMTSQTELGDRELCLRSGCAAHFANHEIGGEALFTALEALLIPKDTASSNL